MSYSHSKYQLFDYIQLFVISNGVNTKYYTNNHRKYINFEQTFYWANENNERIGELSKFAFQFLDPCHVSKIICRYIVLTHEPEILMVLRPYQYYAVEKILQKVEETDTNGYIWHTTGSGKRLTSFMASRLLSRNKDIAKVVFVVDRKDLDVQTMGEFNNFSKGSVDGTSNTNALVEQFGDNTSLIVTTIQKLDNAIKKDQHKGVMSTLKDEKVIFIFDECHRSQFGDSHKRIKEHFANAQMIGFTGTPIFAQNANKGRTTKDLFGECLHKYNIVDAIADENVLKFSIEYTNTIQAKDNTTDIDVVDIDRKEVYQAPKRINNIVDTILNVHNIKTYNKEFTAMFCVQDIESLTMYYDSFKGKEHNLKIATIFSYRPNDAKESSYYGDDGLEEEEIPIYAGEKLESYMQDYNQEFGTSFNLNNYDGYFKDIGKRVKNREIDILLVVNMFLTGFDSKTLNTLYVDKSLQYHGLIQAYSRTNRILNSRKTFCS